MNKKFAEVLAELLQLAHDEGVKTATEQITNAPDPPVEPVPEAPAPDPAPDPRDARIAELETLVERLKERRNYWRQMTSQAREWIREKDKRLQVLTDSLNEALAEINEMRYEIKEMRVHWIGPKVPVKNPQEPHRSDV